MTYKSGLTAGLALGIAVIWLVSCGMSHKSPKLYWFIPDGTRADLRAVSDV